MRFGDLCSDLPMWAHPVVWIALLFWEFWLGKTKFGSTIQLLMTSLGQMWTAMKAKGKQNDKSI